MHNRRQNADAELALDVPGVARQTALDGQERLATQNDRVPQEQPVLLHLDTRRERSASSPVPPLSGVPRMPRTSSTPFDFRKCLSYDADRKRLFHTQLEEPASAPAEKDAGVAAGGRLAHLHVKTLAVEDDFARRRCRPGSSEGRRRRRQGRAPSCEGRRDYVGGRNHFGFARPFPSLRLHAPPDEAGELPERCNFILQQRF
jgi:hypothetical protein